MKLYFNSTTATLKNGQISQYSDLARRTMGTIHSLFPHVLRFIQNNIIFSFLHKQQQLTLGVPETKHLPSIVDKVSCTLGCTLRAKMISNSTTVLAI
jgi:hypothetical protein